MPLTDAALFDGTRFVADPWRSLQDGEEMPAAGHVILTLEQWRTLGPISADVPVGLALGPATSLDSLDDIARFAVLALAFPKFSDGRAYSLGHRLRTTFGYRGELRASGDVLFDQLQLMMRCGFDTFEISDPVTRALLEEGRRPDVPRFYQPGFGAEVPASTRPWARQHV